MSVARPARGRIVALLGAESTGKTTLSLALREALVGAGWVDADRIAVVGEYLREFCDREGRTPRPDEQAGIADEQTRRIEDAAANHAVVIADTTALMTAIYHRWVFGDRSLDTRAAAAHAEVDLTLLTALDLPWRSDGLQRDGPGVREPIDAMLRETLEGIGRPYAVVCGSGPARVDAALRAVRPLLTLDPRGTATASPDAAFSTGWRHRCERCDDPACDRTHRLP